MRKFLLFTVVVFASCTMPNKISWDNYKADNTRHIGSKAFETKIDNATYSFTLTAFSRQKSKYYCLLISSLWKLENNGIVLFKLGNDETIKLIADNTNVGQIDWPTYSPIIGGASYSGVLTTNKTDYYTSIYLLEDTVLKKIEQYGINKVRIQFVTTYKEQSWTTDRLGKYIKNSHQLIELQLQKALTKPKSIEQDF